jgi:hypothetical protein
MQSVVGRNVAMTRIPVHMYYYDYVFSLQMAFVSATIATLMFTGPGLSLDLTMRAGSLQWHGSNAMCL